MPSSTLRRSGHGPVRGTTPPRVPTPPVPTPDAATPAPTPPTLDQVRETVRDEMSKLTPAATPVTVKPVKPELALTREEVVELRVLLTGSHFTTARELISAIRRVMSFSLIDPSDPTRELAVLTIAEDALERLHGRRPDDTPFAEFIQQKFDEWVEMYVNGGLP